MKRKALTTIALSSFALAWQAQAQGSPSISI